MAASTLPYTGVGDLAGLIKTAYDQSVRLQLRTIPQFRTIADVRPANLTNPGSTVTWSFHNELAAATTPLTNDYTDPDGTQLSDVSTVSVTVAEYGNFTVATKQMGLHVFDGSIDPNIANLLAYNQAITVDALVEAKLQTGGNVLREISGAQSTAAITGVTGTDVLKSRDFRYVVAKLRTSAVQPWDGQFYLAWVHPEVSVDLRSETDAAGWRTPLNYGAAGEAGSIIAGELGAYESVRFIENPRVLNSQRGAGSGGSQVRVYNTYVHGKEALAEVVSEEFHTVIDGTIADPLGRKKAIGWTGTAGWGLFRTASLWQIQTASSVRATT